MNIVSIVAQSTNTLSLTCTSTTPLYMYSHILYSINQSTVLLCVYCDNHSTRDCLWRAECRWINWSWPTALTGTWVRLRNGSSRWLCWTGIDGPAPTRMLLKSVITSIVCRKIIAYQYVYPVSCFLHGGQLHRSRDHNCIVENEAHIGL